jgi:hypothetical protein
MDRPVKYVGNSCPWNDFLVIPSKEWTREQLGISEVRDVSYGRINSDVDYNEFSDRVQRVPKVTICERSESGVTVKDVELDHEVFQNVKITLLDQVCPLYTLARLGDGVPGRIA